MSAPHRCSDCQHRPRPRRVTPTAKKHKGRLGDARLHKKPCDCDCHSPTKSDGAADTGPAA